MQRLRPSGEDGAVAVLVGILTLVLFGMAALVIDVGAMYAERRQLQNGADAAALAIALECAKGRPCGPGINGGMALQYANSNANDGEANLEDVTPDVGLQVVSVGLSTLNDGATALPPVFGGLLRPDGYDGATIRANATARWGGPFRTSAVPLGIGRGEFDAMTDGGTRYATRPFPDEGTTIFFDTPDDGKARGFGWLPPTTDCDVTLQVDEPLLINPLPPPLPVGTGCTAGILQDFIDSGEPITVPIYRRVDGLSTDSSVDGFAAFVLTGYRLEGSRRRWTSRGQPPCGPDDACIRGHFVFITTDVGDFGGPPMGLTVVRLID
jgi:Flp pilus assembly protein TadG